MSDDSIKTDDSQNRVIFSADDKQDNTNISAEEQDNNINDDNHQQQDQETTVFQASDLKDSKELINEESIKDDQKFYGENTESEEPYKQVVEEVNEPETSDQVHQPEIVEETVSDDITPEILEQPEYSQGDSGDPPVYSDNRSKLLFIVLGSVIFIIIFIFIISLFFRKGSKPKEKVELTYWGLWEDKQSIQPIIDTYQKENPRVTINYIKMETNQYREKLVERIRNGKGPDIFRFHNTWVNMIREVLTTLPKSIMSNEEYEKTFYPVYQSDLKVGGDYVGIPLYMENIVLLYNKELFNKAGISLPPKTWDDIISYAPQLTVADQNNIIINSGIALGTAENIDNFSDILGVLFLQNGVNIHNINSSEGIQVLEFYRKFAEPPNNVWDSNMPSSINAFATQKVAMIFAPSWQIHTIKAINPDLQFSAVPIPVVPNGQPVSLATYWVEGVSKGSKFQLEAWKFLSYLSKKETLSELYKEQSKTRIFGEPFSRVDMANEIISQDYVGSVIEQAPYSKSLPVASRTHDNGINDEIIMYLKNAVNSTINGISYEESFDTAQKGIQQVLEKFNYPKNE